MKMTKLNLETLVKLYKRNTRMKWVACHHCGRMFVIDKRNIRVDTKCSSC
jgi:hypothetical protein